MLTFNLKEVIMMKENTKRRTSITVTAKTLAKFNYLRTIQGVTADVMLDHLIEFYEKNKKD